MSALPIFLRDEGDLDMSWYADAACQGKPTLLFFPGRGASSQTQNATAKAVCASCPVKDACLDIAMRTHPDGIWGGTTWTDRKNMRAEARRKKRVA